MNYRRDFEPSPLDGAPTMAAPAAGQQPGAWAQQAPYGGAGAPYGQQPPGMYYDQQPTSYGQQVPAPPQLPVYKRPGVVFGAAAVAAVAAVGALLATWVSHDDVSTTPVNTTGTPSQQVQVPLVPVQPSAPPPSQSVVVQQPAPRQQAPRQQAPAPRVAPVNPSAVNPAPLSPNSPVPEPNPNPDPVQKQDPQPPPKEDPVDVKDPETGADTRGKVESPPPDLNPGDPENPTPDDLLCHPNPPGCTGDQKAPEKVEPPQQQPAP